MLRQLDSLCVLIVSAFLCAGCVYQYIRTCTRHSSAAASAAAGTGTKQQQQQQRGTCSAGRAAGAQQQ